MLVAVAALTFAAAAFAATIATAAGVGGSDTSATSAANDTELSLVAYTTPREAYAKLIPMFQKTAAGKDVSFKQSYGASGEQARAVRAGLDADLVALSLAPDIDTLTPDIVAPTWKQQPYKGMVTNSVVVFVLRDGNPKKIKGWNDLLRPDVDVVTPNPFTSGGARWNVMAAYGAWRRAGKSDKQAQANLLKLFKNVVVQDVGARQSLSTFNSGKGDVLLAYENEAYFSRLQGLGLQWIIPKSTILIENPIAVTKTSESKAKANAFVRFLRTPAAQNVFASQGYRSILPSVEKRYRSKFPVRPGLFTIDAKSMGGWTRVSKRFFDPKTGIMARIQRQVGGSTG
jgi:sulfate transport system substrate-binding protein